MARTTKLSGLVSGQSTAATPKFSTYTNFGQLVREFFEKEKAVKEDCNVIQKSPINKKIEEENPSEVKDKTEKPKGLAQHKNIATPGSPKSKGKEPKYTKLSNFIPVEVKRNENEKAEITGKFDEDLMEEEEAEEKPDPRHVVSEDVTVIKPEDKDQYSKDTFKQGSDAARRLSKKDPNWKPASHPDYRKDKKESIQLSNILSPQLKEKWAGDADIKKLDKYGKEQQSLAQLKSKQSALRSKKDRTDADSKELKRINFAIRARTGWGKAESVSEKFDRYSIQNISNNPKHPEHKKIRDSKPGSTWKMDSGAIGSKSPDGRIRYFQPAKKSEADEWSRTGKVSRESKPQGK